MMFPVPLWIPVAAAIAGLVAFARSGSAQPRDTRASARSGRDGPRNTAEWQRGGSSSAPVPSALEVFNAFLRSGKAPPREIAELARDEARAAGISDLAADIERTFLQGLPSKAGPSGDTRVAQTSSAPISVGKAPPSDAALIGHGPAGAAGPTSGDADQGLPPDLMSAITGYRGSRIPMTAPMMIEDQIGNGNGNGNGNGESSPIPGVSAKQWGQLRTVLAREPSSYDSGRHVGRYRQSKQRLSELGIDPQSIAKNPDAQDRALEVDLADAYRHLVAGRVVDRVVGRPIVLPDMDDAQVVTVPGLLGVCAAAGLDQCASWLRSKTDRARFRHTTNLFLRCNAVGLES
jgi:hypothetical protein